MPESKWTTEQLRAITERGRNILVSAGAGSGKTAVMVERIVRLVIEDKVPVSAMLIVTFTKAAASEMKERLRNALKDRLAELSGGSGNSVDAEQAWVKEQLDKLHNAPISTFHSFAERVLKEFFYLTDVEPGFRVLDEAESEVLKEQAIEALFNAEYEEDSPGFREFLDAYSGEKSDIEARDMVRELYRKLEAVPDRFTVLDERVEELSRDVLEFRNSACFNRLVELMKRELGEAISSAEAASEVLLDYGLGRLSDLVLADKAVLESAGELLGKGDTEGAVGLLRSTKFQTVGAKGKDEKEIYTEDIKNTVKAIREDYKGRVKGICSLYYADINRMVRTIQLTYEYAKTLAGLERRFYEMYRSIKNDINSIDFSDMEHYAYQILLNKEASNYYRETFQYIFVDEYQDTNIMQETIIGMIRRDDNLFMVGDIKQSIYHFRLADPEIFKEKYAAYKLEGEKGDEAVSVKIDLNRNFRSKSTVLDEINKMFRPLMEGYDKDAELVPGNPDGECLLRAPETHIVDTSNLEESDEDIREMRKEELEASEAVRIIQSLIGNEYTDSKSGEVRKIDYRDIVILMRSFRRSAEGYRDVFKKYGIPLFIDDRDGYFDSIEINVFLSLLSVIDNKRQDVPFIALLRSEIFGFSCTELAMIRKYHEEGSFVDAAKALTSDESVSGALSILQEKCRKVFADIRKWQAYAVTIPLPDLIWRLMNETGYYMTAGTLPDGAVRQANLRLLADRAREYSARSLGSLYGFIKYIEEVKSNKVDIPQATLLSENENVVRVMTVHHSKGLEFPVVILAGMDNAHSGTGMPKISFDREIGLGLRAEDPENHFYEEGLISRVIKSREHVSEVDELKRVFYVAVTRARETFFLLGAADYDRIVDGIENSVHSDSTLLKMSEYLPGIVKVMPDELKDIPVSIDNEEEQEHRDAAKEHEEVIKRLGYEYPYAYAGALAAKTSVTGINKARAESMMSEEPPEEAVSQKSIREMQDMDDAPKAEDYDVPEFMRGKEAVSAARRGTVYHGIMERLDFVRASAEGIPYITQTMSRIKEDGIFTDEEIKAVSPEKINAFFGTELGKRAAAAAEQNRLFREQTFEAKMQVSGEDVLVQGVIDCCFEEPDGIVLLDYKTNYVDRSLGIDEEIKRVVSMYETQLDIYSDALEDALRKTVKEKYLYLFSLDREVKVR